MTEATIDYSAIKVEDLDIKREPRKSKFALVHKPTGTVAADPVVPGSLTEARFRRATGLPKENRVKDMIGYIEGRGDDANFYVIVGGDSPRNEYLEKIASDPVALKACFEGAPPKDDSTEQPVPTPEPEAPTEAETAPVEVTPPTQESVAPDPEAPGDEPAPEPSPAADTPEDPPADGGKVDPGEVEKLDDLLAGLQ